MEVTEGFLQAGPDTDIDINNVTMRFAMDVTGLVGFGKDYKTCHTFNDAGTDELFDILRQCKASSSPLTLLQILYLQVPWCQICIADVCLSS